MRLTSNANDFINAKSHDGKKPLHAGLTTSYDENFFIYHKPSIKGAYLFQAHLRRGRHSFERGRGLFNLEKMMVSVLHKELEHKVEKLTRTRRLEVMLPRIRIKSKLPIGK